MGTQKQPYSICPQQAHLKHDYFCALFAWLMITQHVTHPFRIRVSASFHFPFPFITIKAEQVFDLLKCQCIILDFLFAELSAAGLTWRVSRLVLLCSGSCEVDAGTWR